jgi:putative chitinase
MHILTADQLRKAAPFCKDPADWVGPLNDAMLLYGISMDPDFMVEFLAQCAHETCSFNRLEENLMYSAEQLMKVWPKRFPTLAVATQYASKPHALADFVYGGRMGNVKTGDGWKYRGRGMPMVTGYDNYKLVAKRLNDADIMFCPDKLCTRKTAALAGAAWWAANPQLNQLADDQIGDDDVADFVSITRIVNGGTEGLASRAKFRAAFKTALAD